MTKGSVFFISYGISFFGIFVIQRKKGGCRAPLPRLGWKDF